MRSKLINISVKKDSISILFLLMILICLGACSPKHSSYSDFIEIEAGGWSRNVPCEFVPQFGDSLALYEVKVAFCYENNYPYRNMNLIVDYLSEDSLVKRTDVDFAVADAYGNRKNPGFGVAYQAESRLEGRVAPGTFDKIRIWHGLDCDTLKNITRVGVILSPVKQ